MKILVISLAGIGDTLIATPFIRELRENFPGVTIDALVRWPGAKDLLEHNPNVNRVFQKDLMTCGKFEALRFFRLLRRERYQLSINTHPQGPRLYRVAAWLAGAEVRISHEYERFTWLDRLLVTGTLPQDYSRHSIENNFDILPLIGAKKKPASHELEFFLEPGDEQLANDFLAKHKLSGQKILGIHVGSGGTKNLRLKRWPLKNYAGLVRRLNQKRPDIRILLFGGPEEINDHPVVLAQANPRFDDGSQNPKPAADGGIDEAVQRVPERGHGAHARRGGNESTQPDCHRSTDVEPNESALRQSVHAGKKPGGGGAEPGLLPLRRR